MATFPDDIFVARDTENLAGIIYDPAIKNNLFSEDFQNLGSEITAIEEHLKGDMEYVLTRTITPEEIKTLYSSPLVILPACGANKYYSIVYGSLTFKYIAPQYINGNHVIVGYSSPLSYAVGSSLSATFIRGTVGGSQEVQYNSSGRYLADIVNKSIVLYHAGTTEYANGNGTIKLFLKYRIIDIT